MTFSKYSLLKCKTQILEHICDKHSFKYPLSILLRLQFLIVLTILFLSDEWNDRNQKLWNSKGSSEDTQWHIKIKEDSLKIPHKVKKNSFDTETKRQLDSNKRVMN